MPIREARSNSLLFSVLLVLLTLLLVTLAYQTPYAYRIQVGGNDVDYVSDLYASERAGGIPFRWTQDSSRINFHSAGQIAPRALLSLSLSGYRPEGEPPQVSLRLNQTTIASFKARPGFENKQYRVEASRFGDGDWVLEIASETFVPGQGDPRQLGVQVAEADLEALPPFFPPLQSTLFAVAAPLALFLLASRRLNDKLALAVAIALALGIAAALAVAREAAVLLLPALALMLLGAACTPPVIRAARVIQQHDFAPRLVPLGVLCALVGQALLTFQVLPAIGLGLLLLGFAACLLAPAPPESIERKRPIEWVEVAAVVAITVLALGLRLVQLEQMPFGLFRDEARHGLVALRLITHPDFRPVFLGPPISQPVPCFYAVAGAFQLFGANVIALRSVSAVAGALAVPLLWLLAREVLGGRVAILAAFGLAISSWDIAISRFAMPYVEPMLFTLPAYLLLWRGLNKNKVLHFGLAGALIAGAQYAVHTGQAAFIVAGMLVLDHGIERAMARDRAGLWALGRGLLAASIIGLVLLAPLITTIIQRPEAYFARADQVSLWSADYADGQYLVNRLGSNLQAYAAAFNVAGGTSGMWSLPGYPFLDPVFGALLVVGLARLAVQIRKREARFVLAWLVAGLVPGILTVEAPHMMRTIEAAPAAYAIAAVGGIAIWDRLKAIAPRLPKRLTLAIAGVFLTFALGYNLWLYFVATHDSPSTWRKYAPIATELGETLNRLQASGLIREPLVVYVPSALMRDANDGVVAQFMASGKWDLKTFDPQAPPDVNGDKPAAFVFPNYADFWRLVAAVEPRYAANVDSAAQDELGWRQGLASLIGRSQRVSGPNFPASGLPMFEPYLLSR